MPVLLAEALIKFISVEYDVALRSLAIAQTPQVINDEQAVAHFVGCHLKNPRLLGFRSQSLAPPQALCYRLATRAKASAHDGLDQTFLK
jgi:hypothetical protein